MFKRLFSFVVLASLLLAGCKDDNDTTVPEPTQPEPEVPVAEPGLTRFVFEVSKNAKHLISDLECTISGNEITGFVTYMTDISELVPTFEGEFYDIKVGPKAQQSGVTANDFTREVVYRVTNSKGKWKDYKVKVYSFTGLPVVTIETDRRAEITSKEDYVNGTMTISKTADYDEGFEGSIRIRGRGNATFLSYPKKPYKVKLDSKAEILGMPADKDWVLLANYTDKTLLRVAIAFKVSEMLEMPWTPKMHFVELFLNGRYQGSYQLGEHVKVAGHRLDVDDDGYMIERDNYYNLEPVYFTTEVTGQHFTFKYPDTDDLTSEQLTFINEYMNGFERALSFRGFQGSRQGVPPVHRSRNVRQMVPHQRGALQQGHQSVFLPQEYAERHTDGDVARMGFRVVAGYRLELHGTGPSRRTGTAGHAFRPVDPGPLFRRSVAQALGYVERQIARTLRLHQ